MCVLFGWVRRTRLFPRMPDSSFWPTAIGKLQASQLVVVLPSAPALELLRLQDLRRSLTCFQAASLSSCSLLSA